MIELLYTFILGGTFVSLVYYLANTINNPALAALLGFTPFAIFCCYIMRTRNILKSYMKYGFCVGSITILMVLLGYLLLEYTNIERYNLITGILILWFVLQYILLNFKNRIV